MVPTDTGETEWTLRSCPTCLAIFRTSFIHCPNDGSRVEAVDHDPLIGSTVGEYIVDAFVAAGAVARVYRAHHARTPHRKFALKIMLGDFTTSAAMRIRFEREAAAASALAHPNVVSVVDHGETATGLLYLAMDLVDGVALSNIIGDHPLPAARAIHLARQLCRGLAHAHGRGIIHRDFKPENVLVIASRDGEVPRIADFGLAIAIDATAEDARLTGAGAAVGTPSYAAPEQVFGTVLDERADLFSLGVTMYEMLAGGLPFDGTPLEVMHLNASALPPPIRERAPDAWIPPRLERLVQRLMSPRPEQRPRTALDVIAELDEIDRGEPRADETLRDLPAFVADSAMLSTLRAELLGGEAVGGEALVTMRFHRTERMCAIRSRWSLIAMALVVAAVTSVAVLRARSAQGDPTHAAQPAPPSTLTVSPIETR